MLAVAKGFLEIATLLAEGTDKNLQNTVTRGSFLLGMGVNTQQVNVNKKVKKVKNLILRYNPPFRPMKA